MESRSLSGTVSGAESWSVNIFNYTGECINKMEFSCDLSGWVHWRKELRLDAQIGGYYESPRRPSSKPEYGSI